MTKAISPPPPPFPVEKFYFIPGVVTDGLGENQNVKPSQKVSVNVFEILMVIHTNFKSPKLPSKR